MQRPARLAMLMLALGCAASTGSCGEPRESVLSVSVVGGSPRLVDPDRATLDGPSAELLRATRQGLVAFDQAGQIEPALAESWTFTKDGLSVIFRVKRVRWPGGAVVTAADVADSLNAALASRSSNRLKPLLSAIESVVAMTDRVVEIRLRVPRPNLLELLAQPELGIRRRGAGTGPWQAKAAPGVVTLSALPGEDSEEGDAGARDAARVQLRGERAALAVARFREQRGGLVTGGTIADWPIVRVAQLRASLVRIDFAAGLFGLAANRASAVARDEGVRNALSMAIDRGLLVATLELPGWQPSDRLLPDPRDSAAAPAVPGWSASPLADRVAEARRRLAGKGPLPPVKVALPDGAGMRMIFARLAADWRAIGVQAIRVPMTARDADFRLIDEIAPSSSANWYLTRTSCAMGLPCSAAADAALKESRAAPTLAARAAKLAEADAAAVRAQAFIPLAQTIRWSLVGPELTGFRENAFAVHPLRGLRAVVN